MVFMEVLILLDMMREHKNNPVAAKYGVIKGEAVGIMQRSQRDQIMWLV